MSCLTISHLNKEQFQVLILLKVYLDLLDELRSFKIESHIGSTCVNVFGYADDLQLKATKGSIVKDIVLYTILHSTHSKCFMMIFPSSQCCFNDVKLRLWGKSIPVKNSCRSLAHLLLIKGSLANFSDTIRDLRKRTSVIMGEFGYFDSWSRVTLFISLGLFGCELWDLIHNSLKSNWK